METETPATKWWFNEYWLIQLQVPFCLTNVNERRVHVIESDHSKCISQSTVNHAPPPPPSHNSQENSAAILQIILWSRDESLLLQTRRPRRCQNESAISNTIYKRSIENKRLRTFWLSINFFNSPIFIIFFQSYIHKLTCQRSYQQN